MTDLERQLESALDGAGDGFDLLGQARPEDAAFLEGAVEHAVSVGTPVTGAETTAAGATGKVLVALLVVTATGAGAWALTRGPAPAAPAAVSQASATEVPPAIPEPAKREVVPEAAPTQPTESLGETAASATPVVVAPARAVDAPARDAEALLAAANQARRDDDGRRARQLYDQLLREFPDSRQARTAHISRGRLLLDALSQPRAGLKDFKAYLRSWPDGTLAEEARVGVALAHEALDDEAAEAAAWRDVLEHHPGSLQGTRARARLSALAEK